MSKTSTHKVHAATWAIKGKGKGKVYSMAIPAASKAMTGDRFKARSQAGVETTGTLGDLIESADGVERWTFTADVKTAEQKAHDRALRATHQAAYWDSDRGRETAARIEANKIKAQAQDEATDTDETTDGPTQATDVATMLAEAMALVEALKAQAQAQATAPKLSRTTSARAKTQATVKAQTQATVKAQATAQGSKRLCDTCDNVAPLVNVKGTQLRVCPTCVTADVDTLIRRADRMELRRN